MPPAEIRLGQLGSTEQMEEKGETSFESENQIQKWKSNDSMRKGQMNWPFKSSDSIQQIKEKVQGVPKKVANKTCTDEKGKTSYRYYNFFTREIQRR